MKQQVYLIRARLKTASSPPYSRQRTFIPCDAIHLGRLKRQTLVTWPMRGREWSRSATQAKTASLLFGFNADGKITGLKSHEYGGRLTRRNKSGGIRCSLPL
jgi:hypothetical protein